MIFAWQKRDFGTLINRRELFFGGGDSIYRYRELKRGGDMGVFKMSKLKLRSSKLLSGCSHLALKLLFFREGTITKAIRLLNEEVLRYGEGIYGVEP